MPAHWFSGSNADTSWPSRNNKGPPRGHLYFDCLRRRRESRLEGFSRVAWKTRWIRMGSSVWEGAAKIYQPAAPAREGFTLAGAAGWQTGFVRSPKYEWRVDPPPAPLHVRPPTTSDVNDRYARCLRHYRKIPSPSRTRRSTPTRAA